jgi:hypothetical protein
MSEGEGEGRRRRPRPPHAYEHVVHGWKRGTWGMTRRSPPGLRASAHKLGWFAGAAWPRRLGTGGREPSTRYPPLRALARRVAMDFVLMATSPQVDGHPAPIPAISLSSEAAVFYYLIIYNLSLFLS